MQDTDFMRRAIELAKLGTGHTNPNPLVGAVIVKNNQIVGEGFHQTYGDLHAERNAIKNCMQNHPENFSELLANSTIYVTLEPCCHTGKQPPCVEAIMQNKIAKVVIGSRDPNPLVSGKGAAILRSSGITVIEDFLKDECDKLNPVFFHYIQTKTPYVALKFAQSVDGKIASKTGDSKWISNEKSRLFTHELRNQYTAILIGSNTAAADDPTLNCRIEKINGRTPRNPVRIVLSTRLNLDITGNLVKTARQIPLIAVCTNESLADPKVLEKKQALESCGATVLAVAQKANRIDLADLCKKLGEQKIDSVLVEGGGEVLGSFADERLFNRVYCFTGCKIIGGAGKSSIKGEGIEKISNAVPLKLEEIKQFEDDVLLVYSKKESSEA